MSISQYTSTFLLMGPCPFFYIMDMNAFNIHIIFLFWWVLRGNFQVKCEGTLRLMKNLPINDFFEKKCAKTFQVTDSLKQLSTHPLLTLQYLSTKYPTNWNLHCGQPCKTHAPWHSSIFFLIPIRQRKLQRDSSKRSM